MPEGEVQKLYFTNHGWYTCWPKIVKLGNPPHDWDGEYNDGGDKWKLPGTASAALELDLIKDCGYTEGEEIQPWINVSAGKDGFSHKTFIVRRNNRRAQFNCEGATGTAPDEKLVYQGTQEGK